MVEDPGEHHKPFPLLCQPCSCQRRAIGSRARAARATCQNRLVTLLDITQLQAFLADFADERAWNQFHTPKNLAMAIAGEAGELAAVLQWVDSAEAAAAVDADGPLRQEFLDEMADVMIYLARLAYVTNIDLNFAVEDKMRRNATRFPPAE